MFDGIVPAIVTPMHDNGDLDAQGMRTQVARHLDHGAGGIFCGGTNGEFYALTKGELIQTARVCVDEGRGKPIMAGSAFGPVAETAELARAYKDVGVAAISVLVPYFVDCGQIAMGDYFEGVADASVLPIVIYNIPGKTRNDLEPETVRRLARHDNIVAIKDSSGSRDKLKALAGIEGLQVMTGSDGLILDGLALGLSGFVTGFSNVAPEYVYGIVSAYRADRMDDAAHCQHLVEILRDMMKFGNPPTVTKRAAALRGEAVGPSRVPCRVAPGEIDEELIAIMERAGISLQASA
ncbi:MAG: dihydrodipicolinate synthase family protein [Rhodobacteraceae bacterium]|nr:dihydrodipicolinate synthase family protein [Paracoccaceae bacterium]